ncbi:lytic transglycosylase domain-containing protein [Sphingomonas sp.]|uniref:lytic transglycosylase domain-containing protein n=1 Tax=Sphingomonas sp. TaxID=28214 RepID=UPI003B005B01
MALTIIPGPRERGASAADLAAAPANSVGGRVQNAIASAASSTGVDFHYLYRQASIESGLNPNAQAKTSSASGLYQFISQSWLGVVKKHGAEHGLEWAANAITRGSDGRFYVSDETTKQQILALRQDPSTSAVMAGEYASDNKDILQAKLGREVGSVDLYLAHFLGPAGATRFLKAKDGDPSQSAASVMPAAARANRWVFYDKAGNPRSVAQVYERFAQRFEKGGSPASGSTGTTTPAVSGATMLASASRPADTAAEIARMQLAAMNGTTDDGMTSVAAFGTGGATQQSRTLANAALMSPSPKTAKLAYLMLAGMGLS